MMTMIQLTVINNLNFFSVETLVDEVEVPDVCT